MRNNEATLPPYSPEAERGVLGCCLINPGKIALARKAGVNRHWFYDARHIEIFKVLEAMDRDGGGDSLAALLRLRNAGLLDQVGGTAYICELQDTVPSAENLEYYLPHLRAYFERRQVIHAATRLRDLAADPQLDPHGLFIDTEGLLETLRVRAEAHTLPEIVKAQDLVNSNAATPREIIEGVLHQGSKLILGGYSKSYKTWTLTDLALAVATGQPWLGFPTAIGKVLYINLEIQSGFFRDRVKRLVSAKGLELNENLEIWNLRGWPTDYRVLLPKVSHRIQDEGYALVIIDPTYKLLGMADENSATDITGLLNMVESVAVSTGAAVAMAGHFAKGNASAKETIDRISGSGVFARDPDSLVVFTKHEEEGAFTVEMVLRNLPPVQPFVVRWEYPLFVRDGGLDPARLKQAGGRPSTYSGEDILSCLGNSRLNSTELKNKCMADFGISKARFFVLLRELEEGGKIGKSVSDEKWEKILPRSRNSND